MIQPDLRSAAEVQEMIDALADDHAETGKEFMDRMIEADNRVISNPYGQPVIELLAPREHTEHINAIIEHWNTNPSGPSARAQPPSFEDERPEVADDMTGWQFVLQDQNNSDISSCGYDLDSICDEIRDEGIRLMASKANTVKCSVPIE